MLGGETTVVLIGQVNLVQSISSSQLFECKKIAMSVLDEQERKNVLQEANLLKHLKHPHIVQYIESFIEDSHMYIIMEYCAGLFKRG